MRIVFLSTLGRVGGGEASLLDLLASLRAAEPAWSFGLVTPGPGPLAERARALGADTWEVPFPSGLAAAGDSGIGEAGGARGGVAATMLRVAATLPATAAYLRRLGRVLREARPEIVHSNGFKTHLLAAWATPRRIPVIWHMRDFVSSRPLAARLLRLHARRCAAMVGNSQSVADDARRVCGPVVPTFCVYNAVDLERFRPAGPRLDLDRAAAMTPAPPETIRIGLVATMARWKGHEIFLRALAQLPAELPVRGYLVGGALYDTQGSQASPERLRLAASEMGLDGRIGFTGHVADPADALRALDVVVHASTAPEPFGRVIAEAMACGRATVVSAAGGAAEIVEAGRDALTYAPGDVNALAAHLTLLARDAELRARLGAAGRASAERRFDRRRLAAELVPIYRSVRDQG